MVEHFSRVRTGVFFISKSTRLLTSTFCRLCVGCYLLKGQVGWILTLFYFRYPRRNALTSYEVSNRLQTSLIITATGIKRLKVGEYTGMFPESI